MSFDEDVNISRTEPQLPSDSSTRQTPEPNLVVDEVSRNAEVVAEVLDRHEPVGVSHY
jgi:hypothetical protein